MAGRPKGAKDADFEAKRLELLSRVRTACLAQPAERLSFRQMAVSAKTSVPTLKHYFGNRDELASAILEQAWRDAAGLLAHRVEPAQSLSDRVEEELRQFALAVRQFGLDRLHVWGLSEGLSSQLTGPAYLNFFLEPTLQGAEYWLSHYRDTGEAAADLDVRTAAIALYSPCLILVMHQDYLGGREVREADLDAFLAEHARRFIAYVGGVR